MKGRSILCTFWFEINIKKLLDKNCEHPSKNLLVLATEIFKEKLDISSEILKQLFSLNVRNYDLRSQLTLTQTKTNSEYFGSVKLSSLGMKVWDLVPESFKNKKSLKRFKLLIRFKPEPWTADKCLCPICKLYNDQ